jgi:hypothetical protein
VRRALPALAALALTAAPAPAGPKVGVVVGPDAPKPERFAAAELAAQFKLLFDAEVAVADKVPDGVDHLVLVGSPKTNPAVAKAVGDGWPKLTGQGHVVRSAKLGDRPAAVAGGGSPAATVWAAAELAHHFGVRSLPHGDVFPEKPPGLKLDGLDVTLEPAVKIRAWRVFDADPTRFGAWGLDDYGRLLGQLAKLKFNRVVLAIDAEKPPLPLGGRRFPVAGDTPGRKAFRGAKEFENPAAAGKATDADRRAAVADLGKKLAAAAADLGIELDPSDPAPPPAALLPLSLSLPPAALNGDRILVKAVPSSAEVAAYHLSRRAFDPKFAGTDAVAGLLTPGLGAAATERAALAVGLIEEAGALVAKHDPKAADMSPDALVRQLAIAEPPPAWWKDAGKRYADATSEWLRAIRAAFNDPVRPVLLYHAKRCEFAAHYFAALEAARLAGVAKAKGERDAAVAQLEKATESMYAALAALGDVARDPSDRGVIAVLAESAYRPLTAELKAAGKR